MKEVAMKTLVIKGWMAMIALLFGLSPLYGQDWIWSDPLPLRSSVDELSASRETDAVYGITAGVIGLVETERPVTGMISNLRDTSFVLDIVTGEKGLIYAVTESKVKSWDQATETSADLDPQPLLPTAGDGQNKAIIPGTYRYITAGKSGKLFVIYETEGGQYLLTAILSALSDGVVITFDPQTVNIKSKGNWVTCKIGLPQGYDAGAIDPASVKVVKISVQGVGDRTVEMYKAPGAPFGPVTETGGTVFMVKFLNYDKSDTDNPQSFTWQLGDMLKDRARGKYLTTITVEGKLSSGEGFSGTAQFQALKVW